MKHFASWLLLAALTCAGTITPTAHAAPPEVIPHAQDKPPGPALTPAEAIQKMTLPPGFSVELVASEPDLVNPVAMTFDERGRVWVTESLEYPRQEAGEGRDRIKVMEDTDGDGRADKFTIFAEGLNIPSGIAVGYGGVWVANAPDILFLKDTDGDGRADVREVVVTGFGRDDTHELPNSLTWGPDGWLYGLNGVFNATRVEQNGKRFDFTCALFRIHPKTREFQLFAAGTSNPWGVAWDTEGQAFLSACVIDHLWHLAESGYYIRQGGPYPPYTAPMRSIVKHKHQKAAYCGIHYFDSDAYPAEYRERLYMGNIHGNCLNVDVLSRQGSTYFAQPAPDFLSANDAWFMPVAQKTGPDGCLYVLDWYDRYHCYQDARRDPEGIDRLKGRLYRVRYKDTPRVWAFDLAKESDDELLKRLDSPNEYFRDLAQRLLVERSTADTRPKLAQLVQEPAVARKTRMHALWALVGSGTLEPPLHLALLNHEDVGYRAWGVRAAGNFGKVDTSVRDKILSLAGDPAPEVRLQVAIAARKLAGVDPLPVLLAVLDKSGDDPLIPHIVWQNLHPLLEHEGERYLELAESAPYAESPAVNALMPRVIDRVLGSRQPKAILAIVKLLALESESNPQTLEKGLATLTARLQTHEITAEQLAPLRPGLEPLVEKLLNGPAASPLYVHAALLASTWKAPAALQAVRAMLADQQLPVERRRQALEALAAIDDESLSGALTPVFADAQHQPVELRSAALFSLSRVNASWVAQLVLDHYDHLEAELRPRAIELLTERGPWAEQLLAAVGRGAIPPAAINANQVRQLLARGDAAMADKVRTHWGSLRTDRDPKRELVIGEMRSFLRKTAGDPHAGQQVFNKLCGQCHKIYGQGQEVGPDITLNGRNSFEQLLSNVFDPSLVIGSSYQARTVATADGRVLTGLLVEDNDQRVVLKMQGGKQEVIPRAEIEVVKVSQLSLMPEDLEKQLNRQELADLFAFITLDKPPSDPAGRKLPGSQPIVPRESTNRKEYGGIVADVAAGFNVTRAGKTPLAIVAEHAGREGVLRTTPVSRQEPCVLQGTVSLPVGKKSRLVICVASAERGAWQLTVRANGKPIEQKQIGAVDAAPAWQTLSFDLTPLAGQKVKLEALHTAVGDAPQAAYWAQLEVVSE